MKRLYGLDFARAILMITGIFYHSALIFSPNGQWAMSSDDTSVLFSYLTAFTASFRMHAFYLVAGFFFVMLLIKKGFSATLIDRAFKLLVPMVFIGVSINSVANYYAINFDNTMSLTTYVFEGFWLRHLWFIGNLFGYSLFFGLLFRPSIFQWVNQNSDRLIFLLILISPIFIAIFKDQTWRLTGYGSLLLFTPNYYFIYMPYFFIGILFYMKKNKILKNVNKKMILTLLVINICVYILLHKVDGLVLMVVNEYLSMSLSFLMLCLLFKIGSNRSGFIDNINDASYSMYLFHTPIIIVLYYYLFTDSHLPSVLQYGVLCVITLAISYGVHKYLIKTNKLLLFLINGKFEKIKTRN